jgi:LysM repeat protein
MENIKKLILYFPKVNQTLFMRFSYFSLFVLFSLSVAFATAQTTTPLVHTIQKGETLSGLAKKYGTNVGSIMRLNGMNSKSILQLGAEIKIPPATAPTPAVPTETKPAAAPESKTVVNKPVATTTPIAPKAVATVTPKDTVKTVATHTVAAKEGLYAIAKKYKITLAQLREWNQLNNDNIQIGQVLYVAPPTSPKAVEKPKRAPIEKDSLPDIKIRAAVPEKAAPAAPSVAIASKVAVDTIAATKQIPTVKSAPSSSDTEPNNVGATTTNTLPATLSQPPVYKEVEAIAGTKKWVATEGYFALYFDRKNIDNNGLNGESGVFKTVSGWADKKYYILINSVEPGTIVRITAANGKSICAKVLNALPAMKDDNGLICRINNAAAAQLGIDETNRFVVAIHF